MSFLKIPVQVAFRFTPLSKAVARAGLYGDEYLALAGQAGPNAGVPRTVPRMMGVDEDMRGWSLFQLLEHNTIVNRSITLLICHLAEGGDPETFPAIDPKLDVMPSADAGEEQVEAFRKSVQAFRENVAPLSGLRKTRTYPHPIFGNFTAHQWACMFAFHLKIHLRQARLLAEV